MSVCELLRFVCGGGEGRELSVRELLRLEVVGGKKGTRESFPMRRSANWLPSARADKLSDSGRCCVERGMTFLPSFPNFEDDFVA